jgi:hypothetical protein
MVIRKLNQIKSGHNLIKKNVKPAGAGDFLDFGKCTAKPKIIPTQFYFAFEAGMIRISEVI